MKTINPEELLISLESRVQASWNSNDPMDARNWEDETGVLLTQNEAMYLVNVLENHIQAKQQNG